MPPTTIAILGAKGGVGTSLLSANLAIYLATIGKQVLAVDADPNGADLHPTLGVGPRVAPYVAPAPSFGDQDESLFAGTELDEERVNTLAPRDPIPGPIPGLWLLDGGLSEPHRGSARRSSLRELWARLGKQEADYSVVDLGSASNDATIAFWCQADLRLAVTMPEPNAVTGLYRILRKTYARMAIDCAQDEGDRAVLHDVLARTGQAPVPADISVLVRRESPALGRALRECMQSVEVPFVVNQARLRADLSLGDQIAVAARRRLGIHPRYLGYVEHDDAVRTTSQKRRPLMIESPGTRASRHIEKVARRLLAPKDTRRQRAPWRDVPSNSHYDVLEVGRGATEEEVRRAYKRMGQIFDEENIVTFGLFDAEGLEAVRVRIEEAYSVLLDPALRRPYEISVFPEASRAAMQTRAPIVEPADLPPAPAIAPDTEFSGELLRAVRRSQGTGLDQISERTKVGLHYLQCIEQDDFDQLPAAVYVRGFVAEFAKCLRLDPEQVSQTYIRRYLQHFESNP